MKLSLLSIVSALVAVLITAVSGYIFVPLLHKLKFGQTILDIGPKWHKNKEGTPTMGGLMFILGTVAAVVVSSVLGHTLNIDDYLTDAENHRRAIALIAGLALALCMALIGFIDDYIKVVKKQNLGLTAKQKTFLQLLVAAGYLASMRLGGMTTTRIPFVGSVDITSGFGLIFWPVALIFIYGFTNAVNLTDGIDGLASSVTMVVACFFMISSGVLGYNMANVAAAALAGGCLGFFLWNVHPARVFMGDTGSMFLGGMVVALAFMIDMPIILILAGIVYLGEAMSVVIQVAYYKKTKKRLFKMSPIHHHFELSGWSENKIVTVFSFVAVIGCLIAYFLVTFNVVGY